MCIYIYIYIYIYAATTPLAAAVRSLVLLSRMCKSTAVPQLQRAAGVRALPAREENTAIRTDALPTFAARPSHDKPQSNRASADLQHPHVTKAHTNPSHPDAALTSYPPVTVQSSEPRTSSQMQGTPAATAATSTIPRDNAVRAAVPLAQTTQPSVA